MSTTGTASWSSVLWRDVEGIYAAILAHPFLTGLTDGRLDPDAFAHYLVQDMHYLRGYSRVLSLVGARAGSPADTAMFARHAANAAEVEAALHSSLLPALGVDPAAAGEASPTTCAYVDYLLAAAYGGSFADGLAAVLPCYWIYARVGEALLERGSPDPRYQRWIDTYGGDEFAAIVADVLELADRTGIALGDGERARAGAHFRTAARYEWMFWDAAYRRESWPIG